MRHMSHVCACARPMHAQPNVKHNGQQDALLMSNTHVLCMSSHDLPCLTMSYHAFPCLTMSYHVHAMSMSKDALLMSNTHVLCMSSHDLPCLTMSYHAFPCLTMSYHVHAMSMSMSMDMSCHVLSCIVMSCHVLHNSTHSTTGKRETGNSAPGTAYAGGDQGDSTVWH